MITLFNMNKPVGDQVNYQATVREILDLAFENEALLDLTTPHEVDRVTNTELGVTYTEDRWYITPKIFFCIRTVEVMFSPLGNVLRSFK